MLRFSCIFLPFLVNQTQTLIDLQQEHKHKPRSKSSQNFSNHKTQIYKITTQTQIFSSFNQPWNLQQIKFINPETKFINPKNLALKTLLKKKNHKFQSPHPQTQAKSFLSSFQSLFGCQENERIKIWTAPSKSIPSKPNSNQIQIKKFI